MMRPPTKGCYTSPVFTEENRVLKSEIESMKTSSTELEDTHSCQMTEALENLHTLSERHKMEMASAKIEAQLKCKQTAKPQCP